jgi:methylamine dehydrogenase accessory protein MauD
MQAALPYIVVLQFLVTLALAVLVFGLARQIGVLHERVAPMGAMMSDHGPAVGEAAPSLSVMSLAGEPLELGGASERRRPRLLLFVASTCPVCKKLLPIARSFADAERIELVLVGDGEDAEQRSMVERFGLQRVPYVNSPLVGMTYGVGKLPHAVLIDAQGVIQAKGLVNSREHLESLIVAAETGFATVQSFLAARRQESAPQSAPGQQGHTKGHTEMSYP